MPYFKVKEESGTKKLVDYSMPPVLDASEVGYDDSDVGAELDRINADLSGLLLFRVVAFDAITINANTSGAASKAYPVIDGYTPQGVVSVSVSTAQVSVVEYTITSGRNVNLTLRNNTSSSLTVTSSVKLMYVKNFS